MPEQADCNYHLLGGSMFQPQREQGSSENTVINIAAPGSESSASDGSSTHALEQIDRQIDDFLEEATANEEEINETSTAGRLNKWYHTALLAALNLGSICFTGYITFDKGEDDVAPSWRNITVWLPLTFIILIDAAAYRWHVSPLDKLADKQKLLLIHQVELIRKSINLLSIRVDLIQELKHQVKKQSSQINIRKDQLDQSRELLDQRAQQLKQSQRQLTETTRIKNTLEQMIAHFSATGEKIDVTSQDFLETALKLEELQTKLEAVKQKFEVLYSEHYSQFQQHEALLKKYHTLLNERNASDPLPVA